MRETNQKTTEAAIVLQLLLWVILACHHGGVVSAFVPIAKNFATTSAVQKSTRIYSVRPDAPTNAESWQLLKVTELREECRSRGLQVGGKKAMLIDRLVEDNAIIDVGNLASSTTESANSSSANNKADDLALLKVADLKQECQQRCLPVSGTKAVLVQRILEFDTETKATLQAEEVCQPSSSLPVKDDTKQPIVISVPRSSAVPSAPQTAPPTPKPTPKEIAKQRLQPPKEETEPTSSPANKTPNPSSLVIATAPNPPKTPQSSRSMTETDDQEKIQNFVGGVWELAGAFASASVKIGAEVVAKNLETEAKPEKETTRNSRESPEKQIQQQRQRQVELQQEQDRIQREAQTAAAQQELAKKAAELKQEKHRQQQQEKQAREAERKKRQQQQEMKRRQQQERMEAEAIAAAKREQERLQAAQQERAAIQKQQQQQQQQQLEAYRQQQEKEEEARRKQDEIAYQQQQDRLQEKERRKQDEIAHQQQQRDRLEQEEVRKQEQQKQAKQQQKQLVELEVVEEWTQKKSSTSTRSLSLEEQAIALAKKEAEAQAVQAARVKRFEEQARQLRLEQEMEAQERMIATQEAVLKAEALEVARGIEQKEEHGQVEGGQDVAKTNDEDPDQGIIDNQKGKSSISKDAKPTTRLPEKKDSGVSKAKATPNPFAALFSQTNTTTAVATDKNDDKIYNPIFLSPKAQRQSKAKQDIILNPTFTTPKTQRQRALAQATPNVSASQTIDSEQPKDTPAEVESVADSKMGQPSPPGVPEAQSCAPLESKPKPFNPFAAFLSWAIKAPAASKKLGTNRDTTVVKELETEAKPVQQPTTRSPEEVRKSRQLKQEQEMKERQAQLEQDAIAAAKREAEAQAIQAAKVKSVEEEAALQRLKAAEEIARAAQVQEEAEASSAREPVSNDEPTSEQTTPEDAVLDSAEPGEMDVAKIAPVSAKVMELQEEKDRAKRRAAQEKERKKRQLDQEARIKNRQAQLEAEAIASAQGERDAQIARLRSLGVEDDAVNEEDDNDAEPIAQVSEPKPSRPGKSRNPFQSLFPPTRW